MKNGSCNGPFFINFYVQVSARQICHPFRHLYENTSTLYQCPIFGDLQIRMFSDRNFSKKNLPGLMRAAMSGV